MTLPNRPNPRSTPGPAGGDSSAGMISVPMGQWAVAAAPTLIRTLLGSCAGVVLHDRQARIGGVAHIVLPNSRGATETPGKYADTAIPGLLDDLERLAGRRLRGRLVAKLFGGASMFQSSGPLEIGRLNREASERILAGLGIPVVATDMGGEAGRRLTFDIQTGIVAVRIPGGRDYEV
ncbi:MAG: chemotaxis protein CheD [Isosphaeraceae bacterium]